MRRCPRCHTSMIWMAGSPDEAYARIWHCLGCGREILGDTTLQAQDDALREQIAAEGLRQQRRLS